MKITQTGVGASPGVRVPSSSSGKMYVQAVGDGVTSYRIEARMTPDAPWSAGTLLGAPGYGAPDLLPKALDWAHEVRLSITTGTGTVSLYVADPRS